MFGGKDLKHRVIETTEKRRVTNGQTVGPLVRERGLNPALRIFDS